MKKALFYKVIHKDSKKIKCFLCSHYCELLHGEYGKCKVRLNLRGTLISLNWGQSDGLAIDPIEKKPLFHYKPGSKVLSFGAPGCNFICKNCQNSSLSQKVKKKPIKLSADIKLDPLSIPSIAEQHNVQGIAYTYSEPTIFFEYALDTIRACKANPKTKDLFHVFVSNGFMSKELVKRIVNTNLIDAINIDLKFINSNKYYEITGADLDPILKNIEFLNQHRDKIHMELTNLVIPQENDSLDDITKLCRIVSQLSNEIPIHFSRFYPQYKLKDKPSTDLKALLRAKEIAQEIGLKYVFIGNTNLNDVENTYCPNCEKLLISRNRYNVKSHVKNQKEQAGFLHCPDCNYKINLVL